MSRPFNTAIPQGSASRYAETISELRSRLKSATSASNKERLQMLYLLKLGKVQSRQELANLLGRDKSTITRWLSKYKNNGRVGLLSIKKAPGKASLISPSILEKLRTKFKQPEEFKSYGEIQQWLSKEYGLKIAYKTVHKIVRYKLKAKLKGPRPYSKMRRNSKKKKLPLALSIIYFYLGKGQKLRYFCQDETPLGLKTISGKVLTLKGIKPEGKIQWKRDNFYLYGAVEPLTGESYFYKFSHLDTKCFQLFVNQFSDIFPR